MVTDPVSSIRQAAPSAIFVGRAQMRYTGCLKNHQVVLAMRLKAVIRVFVAVIVVALVAGYGFLYFQDHSRLKGLIEQDVQDASGRQLVMSGDL